MRQSYWHLTGNLWALALSTVIALFLPDFGPAERMDGGVGVVIRATMAVPVVFTLLYFTGQLISYLTRRIKVLGILMAGIERGIRREAERLTRDARRHAEEAEQAAEQAIETARAAQQAAAEADQQAADQAAEATRQAAEAARRAAEATRQAAQQVAGQAAGATRPAAEQAARARELEREQVIQFMRSKGISDEDIAAFFRGESSKD